MILICKIEQYLSGQAPKMLVAPLIQLDTGSKYYQIMLESLASNLKKTIGKASEKSFSLQNVTSPKPINVINSTPSQRVSLVDINIEGLTNPKINNVYVNKNNLKLHVSFLYRNIRVTGKCVSLADQSPKDGPASSKILLEASGWNAAWSANLMSMVGRDNFDTNKVYTSHTQQRLSSNLKECHQALHEKLKSALMDRIKASIDTRLVEVMENVIMHQQEQQQNQPTEPEKPVSKPIAGDPEATRNRRSASTSRISNPFVEMSTPSNNKLNSRPLKRVKRQTPCKEGEELDDYVDQLFRFGSRIIRAMEPMTLPNTTIELPDYNLKIFLYEGKGTRAYKLKRVKPAWVFCNNDTISLGITVEIEEVQVAYKYRVISGYRLIFDGDLEARLSPRAQAQFSQAKQEEDSEEPVQQRVDRVRLFRLGKVRVIIRGLGNLTQSLSMMINSYLNDNQDDLQPTFRMAEGDAVRLINRLLANVNVPLLSVV